MEFKKVSIVLLTIGLKTTVEGTSAKFDSQVLQWSPLKKQSWCSLIKEIDKISLLFFSKVKKLLNQL